jgi:hypothetical protein
MATERNTSQTRTPISRFWRSINAVHRLREGGATNPQTFCDGTNRFRGLTPYLANAYVNGHFFLKKPVTFAAGWEDYL